MLHSECNVRTFPTSEKTIKVKETAMELADMDLLSQIVVIGGTLLAAMGLPGIFLLIVREDW